jgi:hypothetical protein
MHDHYPSSGGDRDSKSADAAGCAMDQDPLFGRECRGSIKPCQAVSAHIGVTAAAPRDHRETFRLERSSSLGNEPRDARVHNRIEPDSCTDTFANFLDGVIGKSRDIKIFLDVVGVRCCGERSRAALYGPGQ